MSNYKAIIGKVTEVIAIPKADTIQIAKVLGETVVVSKTVQVGHVGVFFCSGTQLSEAYAHNNNLHRNSELNIDPLQKGFFETTRKVRAQPFLGVKSEAYFADLSSLNFTGVDIDTLKVGDSFEELNGVSICNKYVSEETRRRLDRASNKVGQIKKVTSTPFFKEHIETSQFNFNIHQINRGDLISIQSKRHGTSFRVAHTKAVKSLTGWKKLLQRFLPIFNTESYDYFVGTRRVVLSNENAVGFHGSEAYRYEVAEVLKPYLAKGMTIYGEIVGYANGKPIMPAQSIASLKDKAYSKKYGDQIVYKYGATEGTHKFHIYRITLTTEDGTAVDFTQSQLVQWCKNRELDPAFDLVPSFVYNGDEEALKKIVYELTERPDCLTEDYHDPSHISEGVIVRVENGKTTPLFLKSKSYAFKVLEGIIQDKEVDPEDAA